MDSSNREVIRTGLAWTQALGLSVLFSNLAVLPYVHAEPVGGVVVGGTGSIEQSGLNTTINQSTQNMAIDWQSYNLGVNERVQYIQPDSSSISLNRILSNSGSEILGRIDANGQVILVNPNGVFFGPTATLNVGGIIASGLDIQPSDFMNGNYIFNEVLGTDGTVVNSGMINASLGGNVTLLGKQVKNEGVISAKLGSVAMAAGKEAVLTFDNSGLLGVRVTKEILQSELGVDPAVLNSGNITAEGGRVLLTASASRDVFSQAVNSGSLDQATSVVVNEDGSYGLGGGADVLNTGSIDVSGSIPGASARIILLGDNITSSGSIKADNSNGDAGSIELHSTGTTLLTENSTTTAMSSANGQGGAIRLLGTNVGLFDQASVDASGRLGGGEVLIGGDRQGLNAGIRNAEFIYLGEQSQVKADATDNGKGGKIIAFANDTARIHGGLIARGGLNGGDGGFIETSGLRGFDISTVPDVLSFIGNGGLWLIDPYNITIVDDSDPRAQNNVAITSGGQTFTSNGDVAILKVSAVEQALKSGNVSIRTGTPAGQQTTLESGNISFEANLAFDGSATQISTRTLTLRAHNNIEFSSSSSIKAAADGTDDILNIDLNADYTDSDGLQGGSITLRSNADGLNTVNGGNFNIIKTTDLKFDGVVVNTGTGNFDVQQARGNISTTVNASTVTTTSGDFIVAETTGYTTGFDGTALTINTTSGNIDLDGVDGSAVLGKISTVSGLGSDLLLNFAASVSQATGTTPPTLTIDGSTEVGRSDGETTSITLNNAGNNFSSIRLRGQEATVRNGASNITLRDGTSVSSSLTINAVGNIADSGAISSTGATTFNTTTTGSVTFTGGDDNFNTVTVVNAGNVNIDDSTGGINFTANSGTGTGGVAGTLSLRARNGGSITGTQEINVAGSTTLQVDSGSSISLSSDSNSFTGNVAFVAPSNNFGSITFVDDTALDMTTNSGTFNFSGNLSLKAERLTLNHIHVNGAGTLSLTTTGTPTTTDTLSGSITQGSSHITVDSNTVLNSSGNVGLDIATNDFNSVSILNGVDVNIVDENSVNVSGSNTSGDLTINAADIVLSGDIKTNNIATAPAGNVLFNGDVSLAQNIKITTDTTITNSTTPLADDGTVTFSGTINSTGTPKRNLIIMSGHGDVSFNGAIGNTSSINSLAINKEIGSAQVVDPANVSNAVVSLGNTNIHGGSTVTGNTSLLIHAGNTKVSGSLNTNADSSSAKGIEINGKVTLQGATGINTVNGSSGDVKITGDVVSAPNTNQILSISAGSGTVTIDGNIGSSSEALSSLNINASGGTVNLQNIVVPAGSGIQKSITTRGGVVNVTADTISLGGNINSSNGVAAGNVNLDGNVLLYDNVTIDTEYTGGSQDGTVDITGTVNAHQSAVASALEINSGSDTITLGGNIGNIAGREIDSLKISTGEDMVLPAVAVANGNVDITVAGLKVLTLNGDIDSSANATGGNITLSAGDIVLGATTRNTLQTAAGGSVQITATGQSTNSGFLGSGKELEISAGSVNVVSRLKNLGLLDVTATGDVSLNGAQVTTAGNTMSVNAGGTLTLNSDYSTNNGEVTFASSLINIVSPVAIQIDSGSADTRFISNGNMYVGATGGAGTYSLSNALLSSSNINAANIVLDSQSNIMRVNAAQVANNPIVMQGEDIRFETAPSSFESLSVDATQSPAGIVSVTTDISATSNLAIDAAQLNLGSGQVSLPSTINLTSTTGDVILAETGIATGVSASLNVLANNGTAILGTITNLGSLSVSASTINTAPGTTTVQTNNDMTLVSSNTYAAPATLVSTSGSVGVTSTAGNILISRVQANSGTISLRATSGAIFDNNDPPDGTMNLVGGGLFMRAATGIGTINNPVETQINGTLDETATNPPPAEINVENTGNATVSITNNGNVLLRRLVNNTNTASSPSTTQFTNNGHLLVDNLDAGYQGGSLILTVNGGSVFGVQRDNFELIPDITANEADITVSNGSFGQPEFNRPMNVRIRSRLTLITNPLDQQVFFYGNQPPPIVAGASELRSTVFDALSSLSGQQLIELESVGDVDPAVFSAVKNYNHSDVAIRLPADQLFDEEEDRKNKEVP